MNFWLASGISVPRKRSSGARYCISKLDEFLKLSGRDILEHAGSIAHEDAIRKTGQEYEKWHQEQLSQPTAAEKHFVEALQEVKQISQITKPKRNNEL